MPSSALRSFTQAFTTPDSTKKAASIPIYLAPAAIAKLLQRPARTKLYPPQGKAPVTTSVESPTTDYHGLATSRHRISVHAGAAEPSPRRRKDPSAWATLIESYLPPHLRLQDQLNASSVAAPTAVLPAHTFHAVLAKARYHAKADLLSYLGVYQGRWEAVIWLVKNMLESYPSQVAKEDVSSQLPTLSWLGVGQSLDFVTAKAVQTLSPQPSTLSLDQIALRGDLHDHLQGESTEPYIERKILGQIWQGLGTMILQAADRSPEDPSYSAIMYNVFLILGHVHRINVLPSSIYNYAPATDPTVVQRPPTIYILSKRIMSILSDLELGIQWDAEILKYQDMGYELPKAPIQPRVHEFGPELWLDLVLWACVEGGWVTEGAWIVGEMERRKGSRESQWSVISWQEICAMKPPKLGWFSIYKLILDKARLNQVGGLNMATGSDLTVAMGTRTISREVILALLDGLTNAGSASMSAPNFSLIDVQQNITYCKDLLERGHTELNSNYLNATVIRVIESARNDAPGVLQRLLDLRTKHLKSKRTGAGAIASAQDHDTDDSAAILGLLHRILHDFARDGNVQASLMTFTKIQDLVDHKRGRCIEEFANELKERLKQGRDTDDLISTQHTHTQAAHPNIPISTLVAFLDLITQSKVFDLGRWLLTNDDVDGGIIDPELYSDPNLQPALLRFATATADSYLLIKVLERLEAPLSEPVLHALLRCQVVLGKWDAVEELLSFFQKTPGMAWKASDAMAIARAILEIENSPPDAQGHGGLFRAQELLQKLVHGRFNSDRDPSQLPDFTEIKLGNQLGRIFRTLPGSLSKINTRSKGDFRADASATITPNAFNIILEAVVECYGSLAGKNMWEQWCLNPGRSKLNTKIRRVVGDTDDKAERVVTPTLYMLRNVLRPLIDKRKKQLPDKPGNSLEASSYLTQGHNEKVKVSRSPDNEENGNQAHLSTPRETKSKDSTNTGKLSGEAAEGNVGEWADGDRSLLDWGVCMFKEFGLSDRTINAEIPGSIRKTKGTTLPLRDRQGI